jgi:inositol 1,4,5-triphosphate receptor type 1
MAKTRGIAIPTDLENQVASMFQKQNLLSKHTRVWLSATRSSNTNNTSRRTPTLEIPPPVHTFRNDRSIIEGLQDIVFLLEEQLRPLVQAELSVLVDLLYRPEMLFPEGTEARIKCESGGFIRQLIEHTERLIEEKDEKLCIKVLQTLKEMMALDPDYEERVRQNNLVTSAKLTYKRSIINLLLSIPKLFRYIYKLMFKLPSIYSLFNSHYHKPTELETLSQSQVYFQERVRQISITNFLFHSYNISFSLFSLFVLSL